MISLAKHQLKIQESIRHDLQKQNI